MGQKMQPAKQHKPGMAWCGIIRNNPSVLLVPLVVLAVGVTVGCVIVSVVAQHQREVARENAGFVADQAVTAIRMQLLALVYPMSSMTAYVATGAGMNYTALHANFPAMAESLLSRLDNANPKMQLQLSPQLVISDVYPYNEFTKTGIGLDLLSIPERRTQYIPDIPKTSVMLRGPVTFQEGYRAIAGYTMIHLKVPSADYNFSQLVPVSPFCPPTVCYNSATKEKWWGMVSTIVPLEAVLDYNVLQPIRNQGYNYVITQPAVNLPPTPGYGDNVVLAASDDPVTNPVSRVMHVGTSFIDATAAPDWTVYVSLDHGWGVSWEAPLYAVVVVISVLLAVLLLALMISRLENKNLLYALVPERMVKQLKAMNLTTQRAKDAFSFSTPSEVMLEVLSGCMMGILPAPGTCAQLRATLLKFQDIYRPDNLSEELEAAQLDSDVARNLIKTLQGKDASSVHGNDWDMVKPDLRSRLGDNASSMATNDNQFDDLQCGLMAIVNNTDDDKSVSYAGTQDIVRGKGALNKRRSGAGFSQMTTANSELESQDVVKTKASSVFSKLNSLLTTQTEEALIRTHSNQSLGKLDEAAGSISITVTPAIYDSLKACLDTGFTSWTFDSFALNTVSNGHPLSSMMFYLVHETGLMEKLNLPPAKFASFAQALECMYLDNPYHNKIHAADVLQTMHVLLSHGGFLHSYCDPIRHLACLLAAAAHDVEHVGLTNDFLINTDDYLSIRYNDRSPMENHHLATLFNLLKQPQHNFLRHLSKDMQRLLRKTTIELVLATDMTQHLTILSQFKSVASTRDSVSGRRVTGERGSKPPDAPSIPNLTFLDDKERLLSLQVVLKASDLGSLAETTKVHCRWVEGLTEEFFQQGDKEREAGLPISPLFDRTLSTGLPKSQVGFYSFVALPLFQAFAGTFPGVQPFLDSAMDNYRYWQEAAAPPSGLNRQGSRLDTSNQPTVHR